MEDAPGLGIRRVSLNFCMFRAIFEDATRVGAGGITRFNASVLGFFDRFWQLETPLSVQRQVRARLVPAVPVLPGRDVVAARRDCLRFGGGLPAGAAVCALLGRGRRDVVGE
jgi:hypothetical protein